MISTDRTDKEASLSQGSEVWPGKGLDLGAIYGYLRAAMRTSALIPLLLLLIPLGAHAQLVVSNALTPAQIVNNVLLGQGVTATNVTFSGDADQIGTFDGTNCNIGLDAGMIMCTGSIGVALGPNNAGGAGQGGGNFGASDADLASLITQPINDAAVLEFDFVPTGDSLTFRFVFASEEYLEYVNSINDVFGFFLSGPGINGPYTNNAENIALVPGTTQPVSINGVNNVSNPAYYVDNGTGTTPPQNGSPFYVQFDGFTVVITAYAQVVCGETYHIKLAIGDASDTILDSGVFIEAGSFQSNAITLSTDISSGGVDSVLYEGCGQADLVMFRAGDVTLADSVQVLLGGTGVSGVDYSGIPSQVVFPAGIDTVLIPIQALADGIQEGLEDVIVTVISDGDCGQDTTILVFYIADPPELFLTIGADTTVACPGDSAWVNASTAGGFGQRFLDWNTGLASGDSSAWLIPTQTTTYILTLTDECGEITLVDSMKVTVPQPAPLVVQATPDTLVFCPESPVQLQANVQGGTPGFQYQWSGGLGVAPSANVAPATTATYSLTVTDACGWDTTDLVTVEVQYDTLSVTILTDTTICKGDTAWLLADPMLGWNGYGYAWSMGASDPFVGVSPTTSTTYSVTVTDGCGISAMDEAAVLVNAPVAAFSYTGQVYVTDYPIQFLDQSLGAVSWSWDFAYPDLTSEEQYPVIRFPADGWFNVMLAIMDDLGCVDTTYRTLFIDPQFQFYAPSAFTPDGDGINDVFSGAGVGVETYQMRIFDRWGQLVYETNDPSEPWDGSKAGAECPTGVYVYWFRLQAIAGEVNEFMGHVTLVR